MQKIDIGKIIKAKKLDAAEVAELLFPNHKHPLRALERVTSERGLLNTHQLSRFSMFTGIPIAELYEGAGWVSSIEGHTHVMTNGDYTARLDTSTWTTKIFHKDSLEHSFILLSRAISLREYIAALDSEISKIK